MNARARACRLKAKWAGDLVGDTKWYFAIAKNKKQLEKITKFLVECKWQLDHNNVEERHVPDVKKDDYDMQEKLASLGAHFVDERGTSPPGWYFGAGVVDAEKNFQEVPGMSTPKKNKRKPPTPTATAERPRRRAKKP